MISLSKKVCLLGDFAVGKTSLVRRFVYDLFDDKYLSSIGVKVSRKVVAVPRTSDIVELTMMLWDLAGSERFDDLRSSYLRGCAGALLVCDLTRPKTLESIGAYGKELLANDPAIKLMVAANKTDLVADRQLLETQVRVATTELNAPCHFTSAKCGDQVDEAFRQLARLLVAEQH